MQGASLTGDDSWLCCSHHGMGWDTEQAPGLQVHMSAVHCRNSFDAGAGSDAAGARSSTWQLRFTAAQRTMAMAWLPAVRPADHLSSSQCPGSAR